MKNPTTTRGKIIRYAALPGLWPRIKDLFGGFHFLSGLIAIVFSTVRLLPASHPYAQAQNFGNFSVIDVLRAGAAELTFTRKTIDQLVLFFAILSSLVMLCIQFVLMLVALIVTPAKAAMPQAYSDFFVTKNPETDLAFRMLDIVFGIPDFFGSKEPTGTPFHQALHAMLEFYSFGLLIVGLFILLYFVVAVIAETAQSGTPFGKRYTKAWVPLRVVIFFALLIPITNGLNGGQYITLTAAKLGSGLATNSWITFNNIIVGNEDGSLSAEALEGNQDTLLGKREALVANLTTPDLQHIPAFIMLAKTCQWAQGRKFNLDVDAWAITADNAAVKITATTFQNLTSASRGGNVHIRFGVQDEDLYGNHSGSVFPYCGEMVLYTGDIAEPGSAHMQESYFNLSTCLWTGGSECLGDEIDHYAQNYAFRFMHVQQIERDAELPSALFKARLARQTKQEISKYIDEAIDIQIEDGNWDIDATVEQYGWAGAGIWYNKIAQQNGALTESVRNYPQILHYPSIMEYIALEKAKIDIYLDEENRYNPQLRSGEVVPFEDGRQKDIANVLQIVYAYWTMETLQTDAESAKRKPVDNSIIDIINLFLGTESLFDMCKNADVHPLAQLSSVGKGLIDSAIRSFAMAGITAIGGSILGSFAPYLGSAGFAAAGFFIAIAGVGLLAGFILFYLLPLFPFIYFFFAAAGWLKGLFEALLGVPLWAIAHLRIDGEGMQGRAASAGYFLILEVFIRPIMIVLGLIAAIAIFSAMVRVLNDIFYLVLANLGGHSANQTVCFTGANDVAGSASGSGSSGGGDDFTSLVRGPIDEFFFTIVYTIIVYLFGMSCFKLIDEVPNKIMRWMEPNVSSFNDSGTNVVEGLMQQATVGGGALGGRLEGGLGGVTKGFRQNSG